MCAIYLWCLLILNWLWDFFSANRSRRYKRDWRNLLFWAIESTEAILRPFLSADFWETWIRRQLKNLQISSRIKLNPSNLIKHRHIIWERLKCQTWLPEIFIRNQLLWKKWWRSQNPSTLISFQICLAFIRVDNFSSSDEIRPLDELNKMIPTKTQSRVEARFEKLSYAVIMFSMLKDLGSRIMYGCQNWVILSGDSSRISWWCCQSGPKRFDLEHFLNEVCPFFPRIEESEIEKDAWSWTQSSELERVGFAAAAAARGS